MSSFYEPTCMDCSHNCELHCMMSALQVSCPYAITIEYRVYSRNCATLKRNAT